MSTDAPVAAAELAGPETPAEEERRTSYLELFFDLVFVFAITQVTALILGDPSAGGFLRAALVLGLVYWAWSGYAWMTNAIDIGSAGVRLAVVAATAGSLFVALAVPHAYEDQALWFAVPYLVVRVVHVLLYGYGLRADPAHQAALRKLAPWFLVAPAIVLLGAFLDGDARTAVWGLSLAIDVGGALAVGTAGFRVSPSHFAERYGLFVIIALGESIVAVGVGAAESERDVLFATAVAVGFAGVAGLWWSYFDIPARGAERTLTATPAERRGPFARDVFTICHYPFVLGVILYAVAGEKMLEHPDEPLSTAGRWALGLGIAATLAAMVLARFRAVRAVAWERVAGIALALVAVVALRDLDAVWLVLAVIGCLLAVLAVEDVRLREFRSRLRAV
ncbi:MAG TPA: low temperature requirement protein A [Gaiellaceae bacterium]|nr:low temperature requirement protein A [Gaiellaceae bacterium]